MKIIEVCAAIIIDNNKILLTQRGYGEYKDKWEFPGGKIEENETKEETIIREIKEELDASIKVEKFLTKVEYDYTSFYLKMDYTSFYLKMNVFIASLTSSHLLFKEHESYKWIDISELNDLDALDLLPADRLIIPYLKDYLNSKKNN